ncbi:DUF2630 family protein [Microlunatus sp. Gsoil 973]|uniref:DUF2630 family protein n=1 Tax=Microlunatus sp. Gsoil 973 TaxID=2672569 RepID=UPI0012B44BCA|nr:DUF2630 family protein [Microlunatus sp. Gsoil 973]QGN34283.1 DUF2630 family protein [Microlunatus sp. Gsoil 973]
MADGQEILDRIRALVEEEKALREQRAADQIAGEEERSRLASLEVELDQCWDLLRQRRALRAAGKDQSEAAVRPPSEVEGYIG